MIPEATVQRLPMYLYCFQEIKDSNVKEISSNELADILQIGPSQLRQDFHNFGGFGTAGRKYDVNSTIDKLREIIGLEFPHHIAVIGAGSLGSALVKNNNFEKNGFIIKGIFDINPKIIGMSIHGIEVQSTEELPETVKKENISIGVITTPAQHSQHIANLLVKSGIKAIWNFTNVNLEIPDNIVLRNEHLLVFGLMTLSYKIKEKIMNL